jgi:hypothetical protein
MEIQCPICKNSKNSSDFLTSLETAKAIEGNNLDLPEDELVFACLNVKYFKYYYKRIIVLTFKLAF